MHTFKCERVAVTQDVVQLNLLHKIVYLRWKILV